MKHYIDKTSKILKSPCIGCESGWAHYSGGKDQAGEFIEVKTCHESCARLKLFKGTLK